MRDCEPDCLCSRETTRSLAGILLPVFSEIRPDASPREKLGAYLIKLAVSVQLTVSLCAFLPRDRHRSVISSHGLSLRAL